MARATLIAGGAGLIRRPHRERTGARLKSVVWFPLPLLYGAASPVTSSTGTDGGAL